MDQWKLEGSTHDRQSIAADWQSIQHPIIEGVRFKEVRNILKMNGTLVEVYRRDWDLDQEPIDQVFQVTLSPGGVSAWHAHARTMDRLFVNQGAMRLVLFDARQSSPTLGTINEFRMGSARPMVVVIPPKVWHGVQNIGAEPASILNLVDAAYQYDAPDHWRIPSDSPTIPFRFEDADGR